MIPSRWPNVLLEVIDYLRLNLPGVTVTRTKTSDAKCVVVDVEPVGNETEITRRFAVLLEAWVHRPNGSGHVFESFELLDEVLYLLQAWDVPVRFDSLIGPRVEKDDTKVEYHEGSIVLVFARN